MNVSPFPAIGWNPAGTQTGDPRVPARPIRALIVSPGGVWVPCPHCGGQRQILHPTPEGYVPLRCETCLGGGEVMS